MSETKPSAAELFERLEALVKDLTQTIETEADKLARAALPGDGTKSAVSPEQITRFSTLINHLKDADLGTSSESEIKTRLKTLLRQFVQTLGPAQNKLALRHQLLVKLIRNTAAETRQQHEGLTYNNRASMLNQTYAPDPPVFVNRQA